MLPTAYADTFSALEASHNMLFKTEDEQYITKHIGKFALLSRHLLISNHFESFTYRHRVCCTGII